MGPAVEELGCDVLVSVGSVLGLNSDGMRASNRSGMNRQVKLAVRGVVPGVVGGGHS